MLRAIYPHESSAAVATRMHRTIHAIYARARILDLTKTAAYLASPAACRLRRGDEVGAAFRFRKGQIPVNKGIRRPGWGPGRMKETQFKKGCRLRHANQTYKPVGAERISKDGYLERKINDELPLQKRWRSVHLLVWEAANGPLPPGHAIVFRNGNRQDRSLSNLELVTRAQLMARNTVHNLPAPLPQTIQLLGALKRKINRGRREEQARRLA